MNRWEMRFMRRHFERLGYRVFDFDYPTLSRAPALNARALFHFISAIDCRRVHVVAHSLGGIVALQCYQKHGGDMPPGRLVLMGTPVHGSASARALGRWPKVQRYLVGEATRGGLLEAQPPWRGEREIGLIAGTRARGLGSVMARLEAPHDGTVRVAETRLSGAVDSVELPVTHTGMLFDREAAHCAAHFIQHGYFGRVEPPSASLEKRRAQV